MVLADDEAPVVEFKEELKHDLDVLNNQLVEEYSLLKEFFNTEFDQTLKSKKNVEEHEIGNESAEVSNIALIRDKFKVDTRNNDKNLSQLFASRRQKKLLQHVWIGWRNQYRHDKFSQNNVKRLQDKRRQRLLRTIFDTWRIDTHSTYKQKQVEMEPHYYQTRKEEVIDEWDGLIENLKGYISQLQTEIKVEVTAKHELIKIYETAMNSSVQRYNKENEFVTQQIGEYRQTVNFNDTLARDTADDQVERRDTFGKDGSQYVPKTADIGYLSLLKEQPDPEDAE